MKNVFFLSVKTKNPLYVLFQQTAGRQEIKQDVYRICQIEFNRKIRFYIQFFLYFLQNCFIIRIHWLTDYRELLFTHYALASIYLNILCISCRSQ